MISSHLWSALPARAAAAAAGARHGGRQHGGRAPLLLSLRFVIESDSAGTPLQPEPLRQVRCAVLCRALLCSAVCVRARARARACVRVRVCAFEAATLCTRPATPCP